MYVHGVRLQEEISTTIYASAIHIVYAAGELTTERDSDHSATRRVPDIIAGPCRANELECPCSNVTRTLFAKLVRQVSLSDHPATSNIDSFRFHATTCTDKRL